MVYETGISIIRLFINEYRIIYFIVDELYRWFDILCIIYILSTELYESLIDINDPMKLDDGRATIYEKSLHDERIPGDDNNNDTNFKHRVMMIIITAIVFVAIFDVIRNFISNYYAKKSLYDPKSNNSQENINRSLIANRETFVSSCVIICIPILNSY